MLIASEPTPLGGDAGPVTNENVPVLLVGSNAHGPFGAMSPLPTTTLEVAATAGVAVSPTRPTPTRQTAAAALIPCRNDRRSAAAEGTALDRRGRRRRFTMF